MMKIIALIIIGTVLGGMPVFTHFQKSTGVIIPLYSHPDDSWNNLIYEKKHHNSIPMIAIINPNNGPGIEEDSEYAAGIQNLQHAKIIVLGYVSTEYGSRNSSSVISDIDSYKKWYNVNGIFFDEMSHGVGFETYYSNLTKYVKSIGMTMTVGNPGVNTLPSYIGTVDNIVIYENSGIPSPDLLGGWHSNYPKSNFSIILYNTTSLNSTDINFLSDHAGYIYATEQSLPNPWENLSSYLDEILTSLKIVNHDKDSEIEKID